MRGRLAQVSLLYPAMTRILVGLDGSERSAYVLAQAVKLAQAQAAKLVLLRVVKVPHELSLEMRTTWMALEQAMFDDATQDLAKWAKMVPVELLEGSAVEMGSPWDGICRKATELGVGWIVIGSHGYGGLDRVLGTTAGKVVNHAECSVLVVRERRATS